MGKWWHSIVSVGAVVLGALTPAIQGVVSHHPTVSIVLGAAWAILGHLLPAPPGSPLAQ